MDGGEGRVGGDESESIGVGSEGYEGGIIGVNGDGSDGYDSR